MITKTISIIEEIILSTLLATVLLLLLGYFFLSEGLEIDSFDAFGLHIERLYLKLDKKFIVRAKKVQIPLPKENTKSPLAIDPYLWIINGIPKIFQRIDIEDISWPPQYHMQLHYQDKTFTLLSKDLIAKFSLWMQKDLFVHIKKLQVPRYNARLQGDATIDHNDFTFKGVYEIEGIKGSIDLQKTSKNLYFTLRSRTFSNQNLAKLFTHIPLEPLIKEWSYKRIKAKRYKLHYLKGTWHIGSPFDLNSIKAFATAQNVTIRFNDSLPPAIVKKVSLRFFKDILYFDLFNPKYLNKPLQGSQVRIYQVGKKGSYALLHIKTSSPFDQKIKELLHAYRIAVPIVQKQGAVQADLHIKIFFKNFSTDVRGTFQTQNALISIKGLDLYLREALFKIYNGTILIRPSLVEIRPLLRSRIYGTIDISKAKGDFYLDISDLHIQQDIPLFIAKNIKERMQLDLNRSKVHLLFFDTDIFFDRIKTIEVHHLKKLIPFSPLLQKLAPLRGSLQIKLTPSIHFFAAVQKPNELCFQSHQPITTFFIQGNIKPNPNIHINDCATIHLAHPITAKIKNVWIKIPKEDSNSSNSTITFHTPVTIQLNHVTFFKDNHLIPFERAILNIQEENISLTGKVHKGSIKGWIKHNDIEIAVKDLNDDFVNKLLGTNIVQGGSFGLEAKGKKDNFQGKIRLENTTIAQLKLLNNLFATINAIPALVTLHNPGFNSQGLFIKTGSITFSYHNGYLLIKRLHLESDALQIEGNGGIDLHKNTIKMNVWLKTFTSITNIVSKIPIAGYILLGKDGSIAISAEISGELKNPTITTHATKDTIKAPFNIIKRTLTLPFKLFD